MLDQLVRDKYKRGIYLFLFFALIFLLPLSKVGLSITTMLLGLYVILFTTKTQLKETWQNHKSWIFALALLLWVIISLTWSDNQAAGWKTINLILPFFILFSTFLLNGFHSEKERNFVSMNLIVITTIWCIVHLIVAVSKSKAYDYDMRQLSLFVSHIRFSIMVSVSFFLSLYFFSKLQNQWKWFFASSAIILVFYTFYSQVLNGIIGLIAGGIFFLIAAIYRSKKRVLGFSVLAVFSVMVFTWIGFQLKTDDPIKLVQTENGNRYWHTDGPIQYENGFPVTINIQFEELETSWSKRSMISLDSVAQNNQTYRWNLIRYLASKHLNKDAVGVSSLTSEDVKHIENGYVSILDVNQSPKTRFKRILDEVKSRDFDPNGFTLLQRFKYWEASSALFKKNWLFGVGIGDVKERFDMYYEDQNSQLTIENRKKSHQQFLSIASATGIVGLTLFVLLLISVFKEADKRRIAICTLVIVLVSFLSEDTLETQVGATLVAVLFTLFMPVRANRANQ